MRQGGKSIPDRSDFTPSGQAPNFTQYESLAQLLEELACSFEIGRVLGAGGMGIVLEARKLSTGQALAVKILKPEFQTCPRAARYFRREVRHLMSLVHENILPVLLTKLTGAALWFATPLIQQGNLKQLLDHRAYSPEMALILAHQVASALDHAHRQGIIHRDVKPSNVLVDGNDRAYLADFGLSRLFDDDRIFRAIEGTPQYQSPDALRGEHPDVRDDVYSFGVLLYEILTGSPAFKSTTRAGVLAEIERGQPGIVPRAQSRTAGHLALIAEAAMAFELEERYASMSYLLRDLSRVAHQDKPLGPHGKFARLSQF